MSEFTISEAHNTARLEATVAFADTGANPSRIEFYDASEQLLVSVPLAKPCGAVAGGVLVLIAADPTGTLITADGIATHAAWFSGNNTLVAAGSVSDATGDGPFILQGTSGTQLYAGGRAVMGDTEIT